MKLSACLLITSIARIPSVITSTIGGNALGIQDYQFAIIAFIFTIVVSVTGILIYRHMSKRLNEREAAADAAAEDVYKRQYSWWFMRMVQLEGC